MKNLLTLLLLIGILSLNACKRDTNIAPSENSSKEGVTFHKLMINGNETIIKEANGQYYFSDDEILSERQFNILKRLANTNTGTIERSAILSDFTKKWTGGIWYYKIESYRTSEILTAMSWISAAANIQFVERTSQTNYVTFYDTNLLASWSNVIGMESGTKEIFISNSQGIGSIAHEILHSLGFFHEHSRTDRDSYVSVHDLPNDSQIRANFNIAPGSQPIGPFDFNSIMMYPDGPYIDKIGGGTWSTNRDSLSQGDKAGLAALYGAKINGADQVCTEEIYTISAGILSLESPSSIATLTSLGGNQYKLTKLADGIVTLKSTILGYVSTRRIAIGTPEPTITGPATITSVGTYNYTIQKSTPGSTIEYLALNGDITLNQIDDSHFSLQVNSPNDSGMDFAIRIRARQTNSCGTSSYTIKNVVYKSTL